MTLIEVDYWTNGHPNVDGTQWAAESVNVSVSEAAIHGSVNVIGASLTLLEHANDQHNRPVNGMRNANAVN